MTADTTPAPSSNRPLLFLLCLAQFMLIVDVTVVAVAIPSVQRDLDVAPADIQWLTTAYGVAFGGFLISAGRAADLFGPRRMLVAGLVLFTLASVACGSAPGAVPLFVARAAQGLGAAMVSPAVLALLTITFAEGQARNHALGVWGAVASAGGVAGNVLGGLLTDLAGWRWIFLVNVPIGVALVAAILSRIPADGVRGRQRIDLPGAVLLTGAVASLVTAVSQAAVAGVGGAPVLTFGAIGIAALVAFVVVESRTAEPIIKLSMLTRPTVRYGNLISVVSAGASAAALFFSTLYMQEILGLSPLETGIGFVPVLGAIIAISSRAAVLVERFGIRSLLLAAAGLVAAGLGLLSAVTVDGTYWVQVLPGLMLVGAGSGLSLAPAMILSTSEVPNEEQGLAGGLLSTSQQVGSAAGVAVLNAVAVAVAAGAGGGASAALVAGYRGGFLWGLVAPAVMVVCVVLLPRRAAAPDVAGTDGDAVSPAVPAPGDRGVGSPG